MTQSISDYLLYTRYIEGHRRRKRSIKEVFPALMEFRVLLILILNNIPLLLPRGKAGTVSHEMRTKSTSLRPCLLRSGTMPHPLQGHHEQHDDTGLPFHSSLCEIQCVNAPSQVLFSADSEFLWCFTHAGNRENTFQKPTARCTEMNLLFLLVIFPLLV